MNLAESKRQDLILVSATTVPPVCKLGSLKDHINELQSGTELKSSVAFDPGRFPKFVRFTGQEDEQAVARRVQLASEFLSRGFETTIIVGQATNTKKTKAAEMLRSIAIQLRDVGVAAVPLPQRVPGSLNAVRVEFKPCTRGAEGLTPEFAEISPPVIDDDHLLAQPSTEHTKKEKELRFAWGKQNKKRKERAKEADQQEIVNHE